MFEELNRLAEAACRVAVETGRRRLAEELFGLLPVTSRTSLSRLRDQLRVVSSLQPPAAAVVSAEAVARLAREADSLEDPC